MSRLRSHEVILLVIIAAVAAFAFIFIMLAASDCNSTENVGEEFSPTMNWAEGDIDDFWDDKSGEAGFDYNAPKKVEYYQTEFNTPCGKTIPNNAFYCSADNSIYLDQNFLNQQFVQVGPYSPVYILAHEWGHLIQNDLGILTSPNFSVQVELQADCFAGVYTRNLDDRSDEFTDTNLAEAAVTLIQVGDPAVMPWYAPGAHGSSEERVNAFKAGYEGGYDVCREPPFGQPR